MKTKIIPCFECNSHYSYVLRDYEFRDTIFKDILHLACGKCGDTVFDYICDIQLTDIIERKFPGTYWRSKHNHCLQLGESKAFTLWAKSIWLPANLWYISAGRIPLSSKTLWKFTRANSINFTFVLSKVLKIIFILFIIQKSKWKNIWAWPEGFQV